MVNKARILVVDDTPNNLEVVRDTLVSQGYTVSTAISGERALNRLQKHVPDLILLDVQMPGIDGFETCSQIKKNPKCENIPIIFLTVQADSDSLVKGFSLGAVDYISKPFREAELLARVKTHLQLYQMTYQLEQQVLERTQALESAMKQLQNSQLQLINQEKMASLGNLISGVAHEINNPIGFMHGNVEELRKNLTDIVDHLKLYHNQASAQDIKDHAEKIDLDFVLDDISKILTSMEMGCTRICNISTSLRTFSRVDKTVKTAFNLHEGIDSVLLILKYRLKASDIRPAIEVNQIYGDLPDVYCFPGQLNQVFMNILANAIDMFDEMAEGLSYDSLEANPQQITIQTQLIDSQAVEICIADNGQGMSEETRVRIFDRDFTTKGVGKGTGLGLAIAHQILVDVHGGSLGVESKAGQGTKFYIKLPL